MANKVVVNSGDKLDVKDQLRQAVNETAGTALTISPNTEGWGAYMLQQKKKFQQNSFNEVVEKLIEFIKSNRIKNDKYDATSKRNSKPYKL